MTGARAAALLLAVCTTGCAASPMTTPSLSVAPRDNGTGSLEDAQAQLARAHAQLTGDEEAKKEPEAPTGTAYPPPPPPGASPSHHDQDEGRAACVSACQALASMKRAVDAIRRIAGDGDERCVHARKTYADDGAKVSRCTCN